ncbi:MAG: DUF3306 domain-containing protein [Proteobacteria bacterium]|nr:DUF3306 domain-containing protein [Pseudomonadota bacterium]
MAQDKDNSLSRWSRLKRASAAAGEVAKTAPAAPEAPPPELPPLDQLSYDSDFSVFMDKRVDQGLRRLALKKLFGDPRFNLTDGLDVYAEDYSLLEDLPQSVVATLEHARRILRGPDPAPQEPAEPEQLADAASGAQEQETRVTEAPPPPDEDKEDKG